MVNTGEAWETVDPSEAALIGAKIRVEKFIDLLNPEWVMVIRDAYVCLQETSEETYRLTELKEKQPEYKIGGGAGPHPLDKYVIDVAVGAATKKGNKVKGVRAIFYDGKPLFDGSHLLDRQHIQVAIVDRSVIEDLWEIDCQSFVLRL